MDQKRVPLDVSTAINRIMARVELGAAEVVPLTDANGRYLAEDLIADHPVPSFDRVAMDGYAIRSQDTLSASFDHPVKLKVIESIGAGHLPREEVGPGQAIRIMTGAAVPKGADTVVMLEATTQHETEQEVWIQVKRPVKPGENIARRGEDTAQGAVIAKRGRRISAGEMAMLATFGYHQVKVYKQPVVGIFVTGTELLPVEAPLAPGKIRNSNSYMLESQIRQLGAIPRYYGILEDDRELCYQAVEEALQQVDYLITTGGAAIGDYDFVPYILKRLQADVLFDKVAMRPGSVTTVAHKGSKWIFGLSGNPSACFVGFELFTRPVLRYALGATDHPHLPRSKAVLKHDIPNKKRITRFLRAQLEVKGSLVVASSVGVDKSGVASSLVEANGLLIIPGTGHPLQAGEEVEVLWLERPDEGNFYV